MKNLQKPSMMLWRIKLFEPVAPRGGGKGLPADGGNPALNLHSSCAQRAAGQPQVGHTLSHHLNYFQDHRLSPQKQGYPDRFIFA